MLTKIPYMSLGTFKNDWLDAHYHFSFAEYHDTARMGLGPLRVINDDIVQPGTGFGMHPHHDMEILTYVRQGAITHKDSLGNVGRTGAGEIQIMSAGTGILHAEYNLESENTRLYQIWIKPAERGITPRWEHHPFPTAPVTDGLRLLASGRPQDGADIPHIHQHAALFGGRVEAGVDITHTLEDAGYLLVSEGEVEVNGERLSAGDGASLTGAPTIQIKALQDAELVLIEIRQH